MEKEKVKKYFHNFFLMSVLLHFVLLSLLNIQRVQKIHFVKDQLIKVFPQLELPDIQQKELDPPPQTEIKVNPGINFKNNISEKIKEIEQDWGMDKMLIDERDLSGKQFKNGLLDIKANIDNKEFAEEMIKKADVSIIFEKTRSGKNTENNKDWVNSGKENIMNKFNRKKISKDFRPEGLGPNQHDNMSIFEKSNKIIITSVRVWIDSNGKVFKAEIFKSSGHIELDQLALNSIRKRYFIPDKIEPIRIAVIEIDFTNIR